MRDTGWDMAHAFNMGVDMMDKATREAENALDRLLAHMGDVRHYLPVHSKPWVVKEMAMILSEVRSETALGRSINNPQPTVPAEPQTPATDVPMRFVGVTNTATTITVTPEQMAEWKAKGWVNFTDLAPSPSIR